MASIERSKIKIYTQEGCGKCEIIKQALKDAGISYEQHEACALAETDEGLDVQIRSKGMLPIIKLGDEWKDGKRIRGIWLGGI